MVEISTTVLTTTGWTTIGELQVGDFVYDENGEPTEVLAKSAIEQERTFLLTMSDGERVIAGENHLWNVATERDRSHYANAKPHAQAKRRMNRPSRAVPQDQKQLKALLKGNGRGLSVGTSEGISIANSRRAETQRELKPEPNIWDYTRIVKTLDLLALRETERKRLSIPNANPLKTTGEWKSRIPPYTLGVWLGDGLSDTGDICSGDEDIESLESELRADGWTVTRIRTISEGRKNPYHVVRCNLNDGTSLKSLLKAEAFLGNKHIPEWVINAPFADRQSILGGFCDTDGHVDERGRIQFMLANESMVEAVHTLFWSIGCVPTAIRHKKTTNQTAGFSGDAWRFDVSQCGEYIFRFPRKRDKLHTINIAKSVNRSEYRSIIEITEIEPVDMQCIQVANPRGLFRIGRTFLTTHNSDALIMAASQYVDIPGYSALIVRNTFADLDQEGAIMNRAVKWWRNFKEVKWSAQARKARFPSGATITFGYLQNAGDELQFQGAEFQFFGVDEVTQIRYESFIYIAGSRLRKPSVESGLPLAYVPIRVRCCSNPAPNWVRQYFLEEGPKKGRLYIPAGVDDNPFVNREEYLHSMESLSPALRAQLQHGDWYAEEKGQFFEREDFVKNTIRKAEVPESAYKNLVRYWDLAGSEVSPEYPDPDWTVGALLGMDSSGRIYLLDIVRDRLGPAKVEEFVRGVAVQDIALYGPGVKVRMEQEGGQSGKSQISHYARNVLNGFDFDGNVVSKEKAIRASLWAPKIRREGEFMLVDGGTWIQDFIGEALAFTGDKNSITHDDQIDAVGGAFEVLTGLTGKKRGSVRILV